MNDIEEYIKEHNLDEIDAFLFKEFGIASGACSAQMASKYHTARMVAEKLWKKEEPVSEDLMDATNNYCVNVRKGYPRVMDETDRYICNAFKAGAKWQKEQMVKDAVEVPIEESVPFGSCKWKLCAKLWLDKGVKGNKVKLIIIKED